MNATTALPLEGRHLLTEMGLTRLHDISRYTLRQNGEAEDVLKISYARERGSLLPESRTYRFGRSSKTVVADGGTARLESIDEISPCLLAVIAELDQVIAENALVEAPFDRVTELLIELDSIENTLARRLPDTDTVFARIAGLKRKVMAL